MPTAGDGFLLRELDVEAVAAVLDDLAPAGLLEVRLLGGALSRAPENAGVAGSIAAPYSVFYGGPASPGLPAKLAEIRERLSPYWAGDQLTASARDVDLASIFGADWERLEGVRRAYDPEGQIVTRR